MTKFQKQMLTIAAAGALTAVTALPAMAFENQFSGTMLIKTYLSNYDKGSVVQNNLTQSTIAGWGKNRGASNYTDQRLRIGYTAKASDDLKLVTQFEMNTRWGNSATTGGPADSIGGGVDTDGINVATRHAYLDFNMGKSVNAKVGLQPYKDSLKGLYVDADLPMALVTYKGGAYKLQLGYSRFNDADTTKFGNASADLFVVDNSYAISKDTNVGLVYYLNTDNTTNSTYKQKKINTFGLNAATKIGSLELSGFAAMQAGYQKNMVNTIASTTYQGYAANVAAKMKVGTGVAKTGFLFTSGNNHSNAAYNGGWQTLSAANNSVGQNSYVESGMMLLVRNPSMGGTNTDNYIRKPVTNIALANVGYDANLTDKVYLNGNAGFAWAPSSYDAPLNAGVNRNQGDYMGTELNLEAGYKLYKNLTLKAQGAYVILGGYYKNSAYANAANANDGYANPANPWTARLAAAYSF